MVKTGVWIAVKTDTRRVLRYPDSFRNTRLHDNIRMVNLPKVKIKLSNIIMLNIGKFN